MSCRVVLFLYWLLTTAIESSALLFNPLAYTQYQVISFLDKPTTKYDLYLVGTLSTVLKNDHMSHFISVSNNYSIILFCRYLDAGILYLQIVLNTFVMPLP